MPRLSFLLLFVFGALMQTKAQQQWVHTPHWNFVSSAPCGSQIDPLDMICDNEGKQWLTGLFVGDAVFGNTTLHNKSAQGYYDIYLAINDKGVWKKVKSYGGESAEIGRALAKDKAGNIYLLSTFFSDSIEVANNVFHNTSNSGDLLLCKYKTDGSLIWAKQYGGDGWDEGYTMVIDSQDYIWIGGDFSSKQWQLGNQALAVSDTFGNPDAFLIKLDTSGAVQLARSFYSGFSESLWKLGILPNGKVAAAFVSDGYFITIPPNFLINNNSQNFLAVFDSNGTTNWAKAIETSGTCDIATTPSGNILFNSPFFLDSIDVEGHTIFARSEIGWKGTNLFASFDIAGNVNWARTNFSDYYLNYTRMFCSDDSTVYLYGNPQGDLGAQYAVGDSVFNHAHLFYFTKASTQTGQLLWRAENDNGVYSTESLAACKNLNGSYTISGVVYTPKEAVFGNFHASYSGSDKMFMLYLANFNDSLMKLPNDSIPICTSSFVVYPNPVNNECNVFIPDSTGNWFYILYSVDGKLLAQDQLEQGNNSIDMKPYPSGVFFLYVEDKNHQSFIRKKLLKL